LAWADLYFGATTSLVLCVHPGYLGSCETIELREWASVGILRDVLLAGFFNSFKFESTNLLLEAVCATRPVEFRNKRKQGNGQDLRLHTSDLMKRLILSPISL
jgi:hypothetical protein